MRSLRRVVGLVFLTIVTSFSGPAVVGGPQEAPGTRAVASPQRTGITDPQEAPEIIYDSSTDFLTEIIIFLASAVVP